ncbi:MAG: methyltransferase [Alphaproteobacteria bacterium]|nr:methyltransferase [Alphaproteobacteria bacterium]
MTITENWHKKSMNSLEDPRIANTIKTLHHRAGQDRVVFARALPGVIGGVWRGKGFMEAVKPYLKNAYILIDKAQGRVLYQTARTRGAQRIVEFGASFGISAMYLAAAIRDNGGGKVLTTEMEPNKIASARANWAEAGFDRESELREGDALHTLRDIKEPIDLVFLDGWKEANLLILRLREPALTPGASILCDDIKPFCKTLKTYLDHVRGTPRRFVSEELPLGDGLEFSVFV